jgi:nucleotide-binding universal stress UspA family protein
MSYFPTRILLATDGSEDAALAARAAADLANKSGSELHVMHAFEFIPPREYMSVALRLHTPWDFPRQGQRLLDEQVERVEEANGVVSKAWLKMGSPVDQILYTSEEVEAGLVVVGRRGLGGVKRLLMGSVSEGLIHQARCPVLVLRGGEEAWPPSRVLMADDGSDDSKKAAELAASIGSFFRAEGSLVQVYPRLLDASRDEENTQSGMVEEALSEAEAQLRSRADELEKRLGSRPEVRLIGDASVEGIGGIARTIPQPGPERRA